MLGTLVLALATSTAHLQAAQQYRTPSDYAPTLNWTTAKGPLMYLQYRALQTQDNPALEGGFTTINCGTLSIIAPAQMTVIDPDYDQAPNQYDGLPRKLKVMYLASTFSQSQWQAACSDGLGFQDMSKDQQAVYRSLLPSVFEYQTSAVYPPHTNPNLRTPATTTTLTTDEESEVRIKFYKEMTLGVRMTDGGFSAASPQSWDRHKPGELVSHRIDEKASEDKNYAFGVQVRKSFPNKPKPSDLNYSSSALNAKISLSPTSTVNDLCQSLSALAHLTIIPDARFGNEQVITVGASARAGDVLKALALCVTGTYRKVGNTYVLTSDIEGIGTKMAKLGFWHWNLNQIAQKNSEKWKEQMSHNSGIKSIAYAAKDPFTPNDAMRRFMETEFEQGDKTMPASQLSPICQQLLNSKDLHYFSPLRTDVAEPWDSVFWCFVAPGDHQLGWEDELCDLNEISHYADRHPAEKPHKQPNPVTLASWPTSALVYQLQDPDTAGQLPRLAKAQGFKEVWLQTTNPAALAAASDGAKAAGIQLKLAVEPFTAMADQPKDQLDRNLLGQTYSEAETLVYGSEWEHETNGWISANERSVDFLAQNSSKLPAYWASLTKLANSPGLSGVVILSGMPVGYEKQSDWAEYEPPQLGAPLSLGYTTDLREKFLLLNAVDPVDLLEVRSGFDLQPLEQSISSFGNLENYTYGKVDEPKGLRDAWDKLRSATNDERLKKFEAGFSMPLLVQWRRQLHDTSIDWDTIVGPRPADTPAATIKDNPEGVVLPSTAYFMMRIGFPISEGAAGWHRRQLTDRLKKQSSPIAIDMRAVPPDQLEQLLKTMFGPGT